MACATREELLVLIARFYALAESCEGSDGPSRDLEAIKKESAEVLAQEPHLPEFPDWFEGALPKAPPDR